MSARSSQPDGRALGRQQLAELGGDPLAGEVGDERGLVADRGQRVRLHAEPQRRREPDGPDHPERVLLEAGFGVADRPQDPPGDVGPAAERIDERRIGAARPDRRRRPESPPTPSR